MRHPLSRPSRIINSTASFSAARGRERGEVGAIILEGVRAAQASGARAGSAEIVTDEMTAARRALDLAGTPAMLDKIARARAKARAHAWRLIEDPPAGFPWLVIAGKTLAGWVVIDMDATLVTAHSDKQGAAPTWKKGYGFHPLAAWCSNTRECLAMLLRPGNASSNTAADHIAVFVQEFLGSLLEESIARKAG